MKVRCTRTLYSYGVQLYSYAVRGVKPVPKIFFIYDGAMISRTSNPALSRDRIIEAACAFADVHGAEALSMRKLGTELGAGTMSLYNYVQNKEDIQDGMIDYVFSSVPFPDGDSDWKAAIREITISVMDRFTVHPWVVSLLMVRKHFGPGSMAFMERVLAIFTDAGFSDEDTHHAWQMLASHTSGYAFQQVAGPGPMDKKVANLDAMLEEIDDAFPHVARMAPLMAGCDYRSEFAFGLDIIIDGLASRLAE